jgi:hypothetical protein
MKILFDNGTPRPIARVLIGHSVTRARQIGWHELENGQLIRMAEDAGYDLLLSTDKNIRYQQNLTGRKIALVILGNAQWPLFSRISPESRRSSMPLCPGVIRRSRSRFDKASYSKFP